MQLRNTFRFCCFLLFTVVAFSSCQGDFSVKNKKDISDGLVINEIMASNHTGLTAENDSLYDWIEIKNISDEEIELEDYYLALNNGKNGKKVKKGKKKKHLEENEYSFQKNKVWQLPDTILAPGDMLLVFASKKDSSEPGKELHTNFKLPAKKGHLMIISEDGDTISEIKYKQLETDISYHRLDDGSYERSYRQSPGYENTNEGYEQYCNLIDKLRKSPLLIWEAHIKSSKEKKSMWVEIKNVSAAIVNLKDYALTGETYKDKGLQLPDKELVPGSIHTIIFSEKDIDIKGSKSIALMKDGKFVDGLCGMPAPFGTSVGRVEGKSGFYFFQTPTCERENVSCHYRHIAEAPEFNFKPGVYRTSKNITLKLKDSSLRVHYTLDGSTPTMSSPLFKDSVRIDTTSVIRAFCEGDTVSMRSNICTYTYFLRESHTLPIINICINNDDLYDHNHGIYMPGPGGGGEYPHKGANYWKKVTKRAHVEFYDTEQKNSFSLDCGFAIFGGFSRTLSKKSFKVKFKDEFGPDRLDYDVFNEGKARKFKNLVLRSGSQDMSGVMVRDEFFTSLVKENSPSLLVQAYRPVALYLNAKYFGLYYIREKIDKHFVSHHLKVPNDSINIIMSLCYNEEGPKVHFQSLINYVKTHDLAQKEYYEYMKNLVDFDGLIDQKLGQIYSGNTDVGNIRYVRSTDEKSDKKWYFVFYDVDLSWTTNKPAGFYLRAGAEGAVSMHNIIIDRLLHNPDFRQLFLERLSMHLHKTFTPENATKVFNNIISTIKPEMKLNCKRWPDLASFERWEKNVVAFRNKFKGRDKYVLDGIRKELNITPEEEKKYFSDLGY